MIRRAISGLLAVSMLCICLSASVADAQERAYGRVWGGAYGKRDYERFYHYQDKQPGLDRKYRPQAGAILEFCYTFYTLSGTIIKDITGFNNAQGSGRDDQNKPVMGNKPVCTPEREHYPHPCPYQRSQ